MTLEQLFVEHTFTKGSCFPGTTDAGQTVTRHNVSALPPGSVVRLKDGSRLIHLHDDLWLWCCDGAWCYDYIASFAWRLDDGATLCHLP